MNRHTYKTSIVLLLTPLFICQHLSLMAIAQDNNTSLLVSENSTDPQAQEEVKKADRLDLVVGDVENIDTKNLSRIAVTKPEMIDISDASANKVAIVGKKPGTTEIFIWDDGGKRSVTVRVAIENLDNLMARVKEVTDKAQIKGITIEKNEFEGKVMISGSMIKKEKEALDKVIEPFSDRIINVVKTEVNDDLVQIDMQVTELSTTLVKQIGIDWSTTSGTSTGGSSSSSSSSSSSTSDTNNGFTPKYDEKGLPGANKNVFNIQSFKRTTPLEVAVNALVQEGKGRILSKPRLVVLSGKEASFLVGGEVPIRTTTTSSSGGGSTQENVSFKQYGVNMTITPTIHDNKIDILLNVQISDIDKSTTNAQGDVGYITRSAQTQLYLDDKQTIVLAGLIKHSEGETVKGLPWISKVPVVGGLFRTRSNGNPDSDTELVISLTPTILKTKKIATEQVTMPSKRIEAFSKDVEKSFDKEPLANKEMSKQETPKQVATTVASKQAEEPKKTMIPPSMAMGVVDEKVVNAYVRSVQVKISKAITYPSEALIRKWEGTAKLRLRILKDGSLVDCDVLESSGHDAFDKDAQNTAKMAAPYGAFPQAMRQDDVVITVPIVYSQTNAVTKNTQTSTASY